MRARSARSWIAALPLTLCVASYALPAGAQTLALNARQAILDGATQALIRRGESPAAATADATCVFNALQSSLTSEQWAQLLQQAHDHNLSQETVLSTLPAIAGCAHLGRPQSAGAPASDADATPRPDDADSARVAREMRRLRVEEESSLRLAEGHMVDLPTGTCTADVTPDRVTQGDFPVHCSDLRLQPQMRQAVLAVTPLRASGLAPVQLRVTANDADPAGAADTSGAAPGAADLIDRQDSFAVQRQLMQMRRLQVQTQVQAGLGIPAPLIGGCTAIVQVGQPDAPPVTQSLDCTDPRLEAAMNRAIQAAAPFSAQPGSTVRLRANGVFPGR
ncbi:MAG TPA: hypothetical protein VMF64_16740 [Steroidobacteraceae bacterium]|nr:hypothetical protein [Steroidobacteraceae bacterium]